MNVFLSWKREILPNGMRVLELPRASDATTRLCLAVEYGSTSDSKSDAGLAHLLEHMLGGGSAKRLQICEEIERMGGYVNFFTAPEYTVGFVQALPNRILQSMKALTQLMYDPTFEQGKFENEQKVVLNEIDETLDDPGERVDQILRQSLFKTHPIRRPIGGYHNTVSRMTLQKLCNTHQIRYTAHNTILVLTGNFAEHHKATAIKSLSKIEQAENPSKKHRFRTDTRYRRRTVQKRPGIAQAYLSMGSQTVPATHKDVCALDVIDKVMGGGTSSRLFTELREKRGLAYGVESAHYNGSDFGFFTASCALKSKNLQKATRLIQEEFLKMRNEKISTEELNKGKDMILGSIFQQADNPLGCPAMLAETEILFHSEHAITDYLKQVKKVAADDIIRVANKYLDEDSFSTAIITPKPSK